jgi:hypothetical protein
MNRIMWLMEFRLAGMGVGLGVGVGAALLDETPWQPLRRNNVAQAQLRSSAFLIRNKHLFIKVTKRRTLLDGMRQTE